MDNTIQIRQRGVLTLPNDIRDKYKIKEGDSYRLVDLDGIFILTPMIALVPELAAEIERMRMDAGISSEELISTLREQRERYYQEKYDPKDAG